MVLPSMCPPLASIIASKPDLKSTSFYNIFFGHIVPSFSNRSFKGFPIVMVCFAGLSLHNALHRAWNNAKLPLATFNATY